VPVLVLLPLSTVKVTAIKLTGRVKVKAEYIRLDVCHLKSSIFAKEHAEALKPTPPKSRTPFIKQFQLLPNLRTHAIFPKNVPEM